MLRDNYEQNVAARQRPGAGALDAGVHERLIHWLEERGDLDRALEFLPTDAEIDASARTTAWA